MPSIGDCQSDEPEDDGAEQARLAKLFAVADDAIAAGIDVFPAAVWVKPDGTVGKAPLTVHGHLDAHHDRQLIRQQLVSSPHRPNGVPAGFEVVVAIVPGSGGFVLLDADVKHGKPGKESLLALVDAHDNFATSAWRTPSGGVNVLLRKPPGAVYGSVSPWLGIDVRADGGWVVAPSNGCAGGDWAWVEGGFSTPSPLPPGLADRLKAPSQAGRKATNAETVAFIEASPETSTPVAKREFGAQLDRFRAAGEGSRHAALVHIVSWSFGMVALNLRSAVEQIKAEWQVLTAGEGREDEVGEVACWVVGREVAQRAARVPSGVDPVTGEIRRLMNLPAGFWSERKVLAHIRQAARAQMVSPDGVLAECIARTATLIPPTFKLPAVIGGEATLDFIGCIVADTSGGKGIATRVAMKLIPEPDHDPDDDLAYQVMMDLPIGSGEGIAQAFMIPEIKPDDTGKLKPTGRQIVGRQALHLSVDEGTAFVNQADRSGTTIIATLASAWSGAPLGNLNANRETRRLIQGGRVRVTAVIEMQAENGHMLLTPQFVSVGLTGRILFATAHEPGAPAVDQLPDWPGPLQWKALTTPDQKTVEFRYTPAMIHEIRTQRHGVLTGTRKIDQRRSQAILLRCKVAAVLAWWEGRVDVTDDDWRLAKAVLETSSEVLVHIEEVKQQQDAVRNETRAVARGIGEAIAETARERQLIAEMSKRIVARVPDEGIGRMELCRSMTAKSTRHRFGPALDLAVANLKLVVVDGRIDRVKS